MRQWDRCAVQPLSPIIAQGAQERRDNHVWCDHLACDVNLASALCLLCRSSIEWRHLVVSQSWQVQNLPKCFSAHVEETVLTVWSDQRMKASVTDACSHRPLCSCDVFVFQIQDWVFLVCLLLADHRASYTCRACILEALQSSRLVFSPGVFGSVANFLRLHRSRSPH